MKNQEERLLVFGGIAVLLVFAAVVGGCSSWGVLKDGDGNIRGVGPIVVPVEESPATWLDIAAATLSDPAVVAIGGPAGLGGLLVVGRSVAKNASRRAEAREERLRKEKEDSFNTGLRRRAEIAGESA